MILMVDDNSFFVRHVERICAAAGLTRAESDWAAAPTPEEGLAQAGRLRPELILLDPTVQGEEARMEDYCHQIVRASAPVKPAILFLANPAHQLEALLRRLANPGGLIAGALAKPFDAEALTRKLAEMRSSLPASPAPSAAPAAPEPLAPPARFAWLTSTPEVSGYAHLTPDGAVLEWTGDEADQGPHGALVYFQRLATLCGEELGLGPATEVQAAGPEGAALSVNLADGGSVNVLGSPRANFREIAARLTGAGA